MAQQQQDIRDYYTDIDYFNHISSLIDQNDADTLVFECTRIIFKIKFRELTLKQGQSLIRFIVNSILKMNNVNISENTLDNIGKLNNEFNDKEIDASIQALLNYIRQQEQQQGGFSFTSSYRRTRGTQSPSYPRAHRSPPRAPMYPRAHRSPQRSPYSSYP